MRPDAEEGRSAGAEAGVGAGVECVGGAGAGGGTVPGVAVGP